MKRLSGFLEYDRKKKTNLQQMKCVFCITAIQEKQQFRPQGIQFPSACVSIKLLLFPSSFPLLYPFFPLVLSLFHRSSRKLVNSCCQNTVPLHIGAKMQRHNTAKGKCSLSQNYSNSLHFYLILYDILRAQINIVLKKRIYFFFSFSCGKPVLTSF